jgi:hypothetical protein
MRYFEPRNYGQAEKIYIFTYKPALEEFIWDSF